MKKIPFVQAEFVTAAYSQEEFPQLLSSNGRPIPEIALVGRSNVGKSSLINHLLRNSTLAKTSATPGKTQSINFFSIDRQLTLVDLPGYGYAKVSKTIQEQWALLIDHYLQTRTSLKLILFLIDSRREMTEEDRAFIKWASHHQKPLLILFTKADKIKEHERQKNVSSFPFLHYSIKEPHARIELIDKIHLLLKEHGPNQ